MKPLIISLLLSALSFAPLVATDTPSDTSPATVAPVAKGSIKAVKTESGIHVSWTLPEGRFRAIEVVRNTVSDAKGRTRVATFRAERTTHLDRVPDAAVPYFYWLKLTFEDGTVRNIGPVPVVEATPATE